VLPCKSSALPSTTAAIRGSTRTAMSAGRLDTKGRPGVEPRTSWRLLTARSLKSSSPPRRFMLKMANRAG
jgi:hypothetical protein